ncbi:hypothetical protein E3N88_34997 [Mikania micrantha]|uniref:Tf2-1-like SH3-like domain-containing protein n=1 Tax=Mikania micrantha TaxID=192012 RepID=A0A5N6LZQ7_9ASTR|nr:hypothetical protein E3N88_34997 [Mikania micrantha]
MAELRFVPDHNMSAYVSDPPEKHWMNYGTRSQKIRPQRYSLFDRESSWTTGDRYSADHQGMATDSSVLGEVGPRELASKKVVKVMNERIDQIQAHLKAAQDRQKSYADKRRRPNEFQVGDFVLLKVSPWKGVICFRKRGKLSPRFIGPFKIFARIGEGAYHLELLEELSGIHNTFHVSYL